jgi:hypothetical protein
VAACIYAAAALTLAAGGLAVAAWASELDHRRRVEEQNDATQVRADICALERWLSKR